jgi:hypothetical protein
MAKRVVIRRTWPQASLPPSYASGQVLMQHLSNDPAQLHSPSQINFREIRLAEVR